GLGDGDEVFTHLTSPLAFDTDGDGLGDGDEVNVHGTDPRRFDTDADGCSDGEELGPNKMAGGQRNPLNPYDFYDITNATLVELAGERIRLAGALQLGAGAPIVLDNAVISAPRLNARITSRVVSAGGGARTVLTGSGRQARYGPFSLDAEIAADGPRGVLVLADPYPAAGLKDVRIALAPRAEGFGLDVAGQSLLGPFDGALALVLEADAPTRIVIDRLDVERTRLAGAVVLGPGGPSGDLSLSGGGITGTARLRPEGAGATGFVLDLAARNAAFGGAVPISLARAELKASGRLGEGTSRIAAELSGSGLAYGAVRLANVSAKAQLEDGRGAVRGTISGRR
ncbi:MAG: flexitail domain-containing putative surface protein, partial [Erythrobacter cryptus]